MRKKQTLIVGAGNVGMRIVPLLQHRASLSVLTRRTAHRQQLRKLGVTPIIGDLDRPQSLRGLSQVAWDAVIHLAPPPAHGRHDTRTRHLLRAILPKRRRITWVYISTSGVYGDCGGAVVTECRPTHPQTARAHRRVDAERTLYRRIRRQHERGVVLRAPGIYDEAHLPVARLRARLPVLLSQDDVYTNHIHATDLARMVVAALRTRRSWRVYNACDSTRLRMGDYFDAVADAFGIPRPPRLPHAALRMIVSPMALSFMQESRRLDNRRLQQELNFQWRFPDAVEFARGCAHECNS